MLSKLELVSKLINNIVEETHCEKEILKKIMEVLSNTLNSTALFVNNNYNDMKLNTELKSISSFKANIKLENIRLRDYNCLVLPINMLSTRMGTILIYSKGHTFSQEDIFLMEMISSVLSLLIKQIDKEEEKEIEVAKRAISMLSYSELEAVFCIFDEIGSEEGLLIASKVADSAGITRSVIGNGIKKLESSGVIETRSLGMKGTFIKITSSKIVDEINKMRN